MHKIALLVIYCKNDNGPSKSTCLIDKFEGTPAQDF